MEREAYDRISRELNPGERILWSGQPSPGIRLNAGDAVTIPFSVVWCGFVVFWMGSAISMHAPVFFILFGLPFLAVGVFLLFGRFIFASATRKRTYYGATNQRLILVRDGWAGSVRAKTLASITDTDRQERADGSGTLVFDRPVVYRSGNGAYSGTPGTGLGPVGNGFAFEDISDVRGVEALIQSAAQSADKAMRAT